MADRVRIAVGSNDFDWARRRRVHANNGAGADRFRHDGLMKYVSRDSIALASPHELLSDDECAYSSRAALNTFRACGSYLSLGYSTS
jgi:hypothetical protein